MHVEIRRVVFIVSLQRVAPRRFRELVLCRQIKQLRIRVCYRSINLKFKRLTLNDQVCLMYMANQDLLTLSYTVNLYQGVACIASVRHTCNTSIV